MTEIYTIAELDILLKEFYDNHPGLVRQQRYDSVRKLDYTGAEQFLYWLGHNKTYYDPYRNNQGFLL